jgi:hypothetical protein
MPSESLGAIRFSNEPRAVLGSDNQRISYLRGNGNPSVSVVKAFLTVWMKPHNDREADGSKAPVMEQIDGI